MLKIIKKVFNHGFIKSYEILKYKILILFQQLWLKFGRYNFSSNIVLLKIINERMINFFNKIELNYEPEFNMGNCTSKLNKGHNFYLLGRDYFFENKINWHFNSKDTIKSYPYIFEKKIDVYDYMKYGDYRITWELNRHHHFVWLAQGYYLTNDHLFFESFNKQINHWIDVNKSGYGINFVSSMEIAIRLFNWMISFIIFYKSERQIKITENKMLESFLSQSLYLNNNLTYFERKFRNNHSIVELSALILIQSILNWNKLYDLDRLFGYLFIELDEQFYEDGINFEHSPTYTRFTIESLLIILIFIDNSKFPEEYKKLNQLTNSYISSLRKFINPNGSVPMFSDCDNGRILFLGGTNKDFMEFKGLFDFCGCYFNDDSLFISKSGDGFSEETKWWCTLSGTEIKNYSHKYEMPEVFFFSEGGYYIYRTLDNYLIFKAGYLGNKNLNFEYAPHVHNDLLSFEFSWKKEPIFVDSGTYTYDSSEDGYREYFRSVYAHNTIVLNGSNQFQYKGNFGAINLPDVQIIKKNNFVCEGQLNFTGGAKVSRQISLGEEQIDFIDAIDGSNINSAEINLNFHPTIRIIVKEKMIQILTLNNRRLLLEVNTKNNFEIKLKEGWVSGYYNKKERNKRIILLFTPIENYIKINWCIKKLI